MKNTTSSIIAISLVFSFLFFTVSLEQPVYAASDSGICGDVATYAFDEDGVLTISGTGPLFKEAFSGRTDIRQVVIKNGITGISYSAFENCTNLESVEFPSSVTSISMDAFSGCENLSYIALQNGLKKIGYGAFSECRRIIRVKIPESVTYIGDDVFNICPNLISIQIPSSVTSIGEDAFYGCGDNLTIYGESQSYAQSYARQHGIRFVAGSMPEPSRIKADAYGVIYKKAKTVTITSTSNTKVTLKAVNKLAKKKNYVTVSSGKSAKISFKNKAPRGVYEFKAVSEKSASYESVEKNIKITVRKNPVKTLFKNIKAVSPEYDRVLVYFDIPDNNDYLTYEIYRSESQNGTYKKIAECNSGTVLESDSDGYEKRYSSNENVYYYCDLEKTYADTGEVFKDAEGVYFADRTVDFGKRYYYRISAIEDKSSDPSLNIRKTSKIVNAKVTIPAPQIITAHCLKSTQAYLWWYPVYGAKKYKIYRKTDDGSFKLIKKSVKKCSYTDKTVNGKHKYTYKITACISKNGKLYEGTKSKNIKANPGVSKAGKGYKLSRYGGGISKQENKILQRIFYGFKLNNKNKSSFEKAKAIDMLAFNATYTMSTSNHYNAYGTLAEHNSSCYGGTYAICCLADAVGLGNRAIHANSKSITPNHMWAVIKVEKKWYVMDVKMGAFLSSWTSYKAVTMNDCNKKDLPKMAKLNYEEPTVNYINRFVSYGLGYLW